MGGLKTFGNNLVSNVKQNPLSLATPKMTFMNTLAQTAGKPLTQKKIVTPAPVSNPSATNTTPTVIKPSTSTTGSSTFQQGSPASTYMNTLSNNIYQQPAPTQAPTISPIQQPQAPKNDAYSRYVSMLRGEDETAKKYLSSSESAMKRLADIQNEAEQKDFGYRKLTEDRFVQPGGTTGGAREAISDISRKGNSELADLALRESAAARTANLSRSVYNDYINAGKSEYEAEQAQAEANKAEGFTLGKDQVRYDAQGNVIAGGNTSDTIGLYGNDPTAQAWAQGIMSGQYKISDVPSEYRSAVVGAMQGQEKPPSEIQKTLLPLIQGMLDNPQLGRISGSIDQFVGGNFGGAALAKNQYNQLKGLLSLSNINYLKGTGAISDAEQKLLANAATTLGRNLPDEVFKAELQKLKEDLSNARQAEVTQNQITPDEIEYLRSLGHTDAEIQSLSNVGNTRVSIPQSSRLAFVNNNPGNLRFVGQQEATKGENGFAKFSSPEAGIKALESQIKLDASRGLTLQQFISKYAPPTENNTSQYLAQMTQMLGVPPTTKISNVDIKRLTQAIALKESGTRFA